MLDAYAIGNLTADPTLRDLSNGNKMCSFTVACRTNQKDTSGQPVTAFVQATVFGRQADSANTYLKKGSKVAVGGGFSTRDYTAKDGTARTALQINVDRMEFLSGRSDGDNEAPSKPSQSASRKSKQAPPPDDDEEEDDGSDLPF